MATFLTDTFTDTNATVLDSHTGERGATWTKVTGRTGVVTIQANAAYQSSTQPTYYASGVPTSPDYDVAANVFFATAGVTNQVYGITGRQSTSADTSYFLTLVRSSATQTDLQLWRMSAGTNSTLATMTPSPAPIAGSTHSIMLRMVGTSISGYYDGALVLGPVTNAVVTAAGRAGIRGSSTPSASATGYHVTDMTATDITRGQVINAAPRIRASLY